MPTLQQLSSLEGRTALVTGGSRGLGLEIAEGLAEAGARVWITARREQWLGPALQHLREAGHAAEAVACDVGDPAAVESLLAQLRDRGVHVDVLVNNAGATWAAPPETMPLERWYQVMQVNVTGAFLLARGLAPAMRARGYGRVVNVASVAGLMGTPSHVMDAVGYSTSKAALIGLTRDLAVKWAREALLDANEARITAATPLGRIGAEGELKGVVALLASPAGAYITGQVIAVDGGMTAM